MIGAVRWSEKTHEGKVFAARETHHSWYLTRARWTKCQGGNKCQCALRLMTRARFSWQSTQFTAIVILRKYGKHVTFGENSETKIVTDRLIDL